MTEAQAIQLPATLKGWSLYDHRAREAVMTGLFSSAKVVNRFYARYRFVRSFKSIQLAGYSDVTTDGYSALMRASLHWSAFELFKRALNIKDTRDLVKCYPFDGHLRAIRECLSSKLFFRVIQEHLVDSKQQAEVQTFVDGGDISPLVLAKALRHIFLHGALTPNAGGSFPQEVVLICNELCAYMNDVMNAEFERRAQELAKRIG